MADSNQVIIAPTPAKLEQALATASAAVNERARERRLDWPPLDFESFLDAFETAPEGYRQWNGGDDRTPRTPHGRGGRVRSVVAVAWWSDTAGRKHVRVVGRRGRLEAAALAHLLWPRPAWRRLPRDWKAPLVALVYRDHTVLRTARGRLDVVCICQCGVAGEARAIGWMGDCCGPCHDRRESGEPEAPTVAGWSVLRTDGVCGLAFSPDGETLATGGTDSVRLWEVTSGRERLVLPHEDVGYDIAFSRDGSLLAVASHARAVLWHGIGTSLTPAEVTVPDARAPIDVSPDGSLLATSLWRSLGAQVYRIGSAGKRLVPVGDVLWRGSYVPHVVFAPDSRTLALATYGPGIHQATSWDVRLWDVTGSCLLPQTLHADAEVSCLTWSPDARTLAVGVGARVELWDTATNGRKVVPVTNRAKVTGVAFLPGGRLISSGDIDGTVKLWDLATGREETAWEWHHDPLCGFALSPDGRWLATRDSAGVVRLWPIDALVGTSDLAGETSQK